MAAAEERLRTAGATAIVLEVAVDNLAAVNFYKRLGYSHHPHHPALLPRFA